MLLSVVIPAYNSALYIAATLRSVFAQTLPPDEVLVIDDGSTDNTVAIAESFGDRVRIFRRNKAGVGASRNFGVQEARGEWIAFVDADDLWEPNKLERQMEELAKRPDADVCYTGRVLLIQKGSTATLGKIITVADPDNIRKALFRNTNFLPSAVVIRRSAYLAIGGFDASYSHVSDWDLWLRLLHAGTKFAACPEPLVQYRKHPNTLTNNAMPAMAAKNDIYRRRILPHLPILVRPFAYNKALSGHESAAAFILRDSGDRRHLWMMMKSILRWPFHLRHRYKVMVHMLYIRIAEILSLPHAVRKSSAITNAKAKV